MANYAWTISMLAMTIAFLTFFIFSATRRRTLLVIALTSVVIAVIMALVAGLTQRGHSDPVSAPDRGEIASPLTT